MKNIVKKLIFTITLIITGFLGLTSVYAYNTSLVASSSTVNPGKEFTITVKLSGLTNGLASINYDVTYDNTLFEYVSFTKVKSGTTLNEVGNCLKLGYFDGEGGANAFNDGSFVTIKFKAKSTITSDKTGQFSLSSRGAGDKDAKSITSTDSGTSVKVHVVSTNNNLSDLKIDGITISGFNKDKTSYEITLDKTSTSITAEKEDSLATLSGTGTKTLSYGKNTFAITVKSESGSTKTYTVIINRPDTRNDDVTLKNITVDGQSINFKNTQYTYNLTKQTDSVKIEYEKNHSTQTITGNVGTVKLNYGVNTLKINVKSEKGTTKTYILYVTKPDSRSANNYLSSLSLSSGKISFNKNTLTYNVNVDSNVTSVTIAAKLDDNKASFVSGYGPRTISLSNGNNKALLKIKNERNEIRTYTLNINRDDGRDTNADLEYLKISEATIDFNKDTTSYKLSVENSVDKLTIDAKAVSSKAKISIDNPTLSVGENTVKITVTAENGAVKEYIITVTKKDKGEELSTDNYLSSLIIEGYEIDFDKDKLEYDLKINEEIDTLLITALPNNENSTVSITGNENLKNGSIIEIKVTSESGDARTYQINIHIGNNIILYVIIAIVLLSIIGVIVLVIIKKKNKSNNINNSNQYNQNINNNISNNMPNNYNVNSGQNLNNNQGSIQNNPYVNRGQNIINNQNNSNINGGQINNNTPYNH